MEIQVHSLENVRRLQCEISSNCKIAPNKDIRRNLHERQKPAPEWTRGLLDDDSRVLLCQRYAHLYIKCHLKLKIGAKDVSKGAIHYFGWVQIHGKAHGESTAKGVEIHATVPEQWDGYLWWKIWSLTAVSGWRRDG